MARMAREPNDDHGSGEGGGISGEYSRPDAARTFEIYDKQIAPKLAHISTLTGDLSQPWDDIKQHCHFPRSVLNFILSLEGLEDAKRDHHLLALFEGMKHRQLFLPRDLVTMASGDDGSDVIPTGDRPKPTLVAVAGRPEAPSDDSDLADPSGVEPTEGTGAAAIAAMNAAAAAEQANEAPADPNPFTEATDEELAKQEGRNTPTVPGE